MVELAITHFGGSTSAASPSRLLVLGPSLGTRVADLWTQVASSLIATETDLAVIGWDLPGHGESPARSGFTVDDLAAAVSVAAHAHAAQSHAGGGSMYFAGVSLGGMVSLAAGLAGPSAGVVGLACDLRMGSPEAWTDRAQLARRDGLSGIAAASASRWFPADFLAQHAEAAARLLAGFETVDPESYASCCEALATADLRTKASRLGVPALLAPGADDVVVDLASVRSAAEQLPRAELAVINGCGHQPPVERPDAVIALLTQFVKENR